MAKTGFLNALTVIGYVFVGLFVFMATYLGIAYATGYFNPQKEPVVGLKFTEQSNVVISENGGTYKLKIVSSNATIETDENGNQIITDTATPTDVRLTVRNSAGIIDNTIIAIPEIVKTGEEFEITALIDETDGYECNVGGDCYINAETVDGIYKSLALSVFVDVPIKEIQISAKNPTTASNIDLTTANFIYDDRLQLIANVFPTRALNPHGFNSTYANKKIEFTPSDASRTIIEDRYQGLVRISYNPSNVGDEPITEPVKGVVTATAKTIYDETKATSISQDCEIRLFPIQLEEILIQNKTYADSGNSVETLLFDETKPVKFSIIQTGLDNITNLDIFLKPTIYNPDNNADPLVLQKNNFFIDFETTNTTLEKPLDITRETIKINNVDTPIWTITPKRTLEPNEEVYLIFGILGHDTKNIKRLVEVNYNIPDGFTFTESDGSVVVNNIVNLEITKNGENVTNPSLKEINYSYDTTIAPTFSKFVFFVDKDKKTNETGSLIINVNDMGQLVLREGKNVINARGAGSIEVVPYVVRTNALGQAVDCFYNVIEDGNASGIVIYNDMIPFESTDANKYVVYREYAPLTVVVKEKLTGFTIYSSYSENEFSYELNESNNTLTNPLLIGTQAFNAKKLYAVPNSALALPENTNSYQEWKDEFGEILFSVNYAESSGSGTFVVPESGNIVNLGFISEGVGVDYKRYMWFDVYTTSYEQILGSVTIHLQGERTLSPLIYINAQNVPIANIAVDRENTGILDSYGTWNNLKYWGLDLHISDNSQVYNTKSYLRVNWTQQVGGKDTQIEIPEPILAASDVWQARGCRPSQSNYLVNFYAFDTSILYDLSSTDETLQHMSIYDVLNYQTNTGTPEGLEIFNKKWSIINNLLSNTNANEYAKVENIRQDGLTTIGISTIQFIKELPAKHSLFMVYSVDDANSNALPDFVYINYRYPTIQFLDNQSVYGDKDIDTDYYLLTQEDLQYVNEFYFHVATFTTALAYDPTKNMFDQDSFDFSNNTPAQGFSKLSTNESYDASYYGDYTTLITDNSGHKKYFNYELVDVLPDIEEATGLFYAIRFNNESYKIVTDTVEPIEDMVYTLTVERTVNLVSDVIWTDELWKSDLTSIINPDSYFQITTSYSSTYTINFIVKGGYIDTITS